MRVEKNECFLENKKVRFPFAIEGEEKSEEERARKKSLSRFFDS